MNHGRTETWRERLVALEWRPDTVLVMARLFHQLAKDLTPAHLTQAEARLQSDTFKTTDWDRAYATLPSALAQVTADLTPAWSSQVPTQPPGWEVWVRESLTHIDATVRRLEARTDAKTGLFTDEAMRGTELKTVVARVEQQVDSIVVELKAVADNLASVLQTGHLMSEWLTRARGGDPAALRWVLSLNPWLSYHPEITTQLQARMAAQDHTELVKIAHAFKQGPRLSKHAAIGLILVCCHDNQQAPDTSADSGKGRIHAQDLVQAFGYSQATARSYPSLLRRQEFRQRIGPAYHLTERRAARLRYFEVSGCPHPPCPLCQAKTGGYTCPRCKYRLAGSEARILHEKDLWLMVRHPGVYCPRCWALIFTEAQALRYGIPRSAA